ncbi:hypothetical protein F4782DRAFT_507331 [Xylaria castorea]|nr:hypothetical protein F4782DRAFT_507331 [Xylaria castorea]
MDNPGRRLVARKILRNDQNSPSSRKLWTPFWLRRASLIAFVAVFAALAISAIVVWLQDVKLSGIPLTLSKNHYAWTYGPTLIFTAIVSVWRQVDYHCKLSQPWQAMKNGPTKPSDGLLLDYLSPILVTTIYKSVIKHHWATAASSIGFLLLKAAVVASTALLIASPTSSTQPVSVNITTKFDISRLWKTVHGTADNQPQLFVGDDGDNSIGTGYIYDSTAPVYVASGILAGKLQYPIGTQNDVAFPLFEYNAVDKNTVMVTAEVNAFVPNVSCELATVSPEDRYGYSSWTLKSPSCAAGYYAPTINLLDPHSSERVPREVVNFRKRINCSEDSTIAISNVPSLARLDKQHPNDLRIGFIVVNFTNGLGDLEDTPAVLCRVDYFMKPIKLTKHIAEDGFSPDLLGSTAQPYQLPGLTRLQLNEMIFGLPDSYANDTGSMPVDVFYGMLNNTLHNHTASSTPFLNSDTLRNAAITVLNGLVVQTIHNLTVTQDHNTMKATSVILEDKLHVQSAPLWFIVATCITLGILSLALLRIAPREVVSQNPSSILTNAAILTSSPSVQEAFQRAGHMRTSELSKSLEGYEITQTSNKMNIFQIEMSTICPVPQMEPNPAEKGLDNASSQHSASKLGSKSIENHEKIKSGSWIPPQARYNFLALTFILPILTIGALEALYQQSAKNQGLADTVNNGPSHYVQYFSALVLFVITSAFNSIDFAIMTFAPFSALHSDSSRSSVSKYSPFHLNLIGHIPPLSLYKALRGRQYGAALSNVATIIGSILYVALAGLWVIEQVAFPTNVEILPATNWDLRWNNSLNDDGGAAIILNNIENGGSDMPEGIWKDLVFPDLDVLTLSNGLNSTTSNRAFPLTPSSFTFDIPALRPELACEAVHSDNVTIEINDGARCIVNISAIHSLPTGCHGGPRGDRGYTIIETWTTGNMVYPWKCSGALQPTLISQMMDLHMGPWDHEDSYFQEAGEGDIPSPPDNPDGCPSIAMIVGSFTSHTDIVKDNVTVLVCSQKMQKVQTRVALTLGDTGRVGRSTLLSDPVVDESTAEYLTNGTDGVDSFNYRIQLSLMNNLHSNLYLNDAIDPFFKFIIAGLDGVAFDDLIGAKNVDRLTSAANALYNKYMVNVVNSPVFRNNISDAQGPQQERIRGSTDVIVSRLTVDYASKLALQVMLGLMVVLGGLGFYLADMRGILPRKPYSIASVMAMLAGSRLCTRDYIPEGAEFMHQDQLLHGPLDGESIRLGWWNIETEGQATGNESIDSENTVRQRFGIDIGEPATRGFRERK